MVKLPLLTYTVHRLFLLLYVHRFLHSLSQSQIFYTGIMVCPRGALISLLLIMCSPTVEFVECLMNSNESQP